MEKVKAKIEYIGADVANVELPAYSGERYAALVPDTLDLQERAALAVNGLTGTTDPEVDYEIYWLITFAADPPFMSHDQNDHVQIKFHEALPLMRIISGSNLNKHVEQRWMEVLLQMQGPDGLLYYPVAGRPWVGQGTFVEQFGSLPEGGHYTEPFANGRLLGAIAIYYKLTGEERWRNLGTGIVDGLARQAVDRGDYAYFTKGMYGVCEVSDPSSPVPDPWTNMPFGWTTMGLAQFYRATGYEPALTLSRKLATFMGLHSGLFDADGCFLDVDRHCHAHLHPLLGILEYAVQTGDREMIELVRKGYEHARANMWPVMGYVPETINPQVFQTSEICGVADMIALALKLTRAGLGDYWDDVDRWTRNHFAEGQLTSTDWIEEMIANMPISPRQMHQGPLVGYWKAKMPDPPIDGQSTADNVAERCVGCFSGWPSPNNWHGRFEHPVLKELSIQQCCTGNGTRAIYYIWENIITREGEKLKVNLLLNRASPWADVDSHIPYAGQVDVKIKVACDLAVRIPEWVAPDQTRCRIGSADRPLSWDGRYALVGVVKAGDVVSLSFPIRERTEAVNIYGKDYMLTIKGSEIVHIEPPGQYGPLYRRDHYRQDTTRWKRVERFVSDSSIDW